MKKRGGERGIYLTNQCLLLPEKEKKEGKGGGTSLGFPGLGRSRKKGRGGFVPTLLSASTQGEGEGG